MFDFMKQDDVKELQAQIDDLQKKVRELSLDIEMKATIFAHNEAFFSYSILSHPKPLSLSIVVEKILDHLGLTLEREPATPAKAVLKKIPAKRKR